MAGKNTAVFGIYPSYEAVERAVDALKSAGFRSTDISVLFPENLGTKDFAHAKGTKAPEGAATGAASGAVVGGAFGWLAGIGALAIPGLGPFIAAGPIMAALAGVGVGGTVGGVTGALVGMGIPEYEAKRYEGRLKKGGILLSVHSDNSDWTKRAKEILERTGAEDIAATGETKGDSQNTDKPMPRSEASSAAARSVVDNDDAVEVEVMERERIVAADPDATVYERESSLPKKPDMM
jgi:heat induced stress protein YflT